MSSHPGPVVLFDGVCNLCNASVRFFVERDARGKLRFAPLDSGSARTLLNESHGDVGRPRPDSVLLIEGGQVFDRSTAALRIARRLVWPWKWAYVFVLVPRFLRDAVYDWVAGRRYKWFGKSDTCLVATPKLRARFLP